MLRERFLIGIDNAHSGAPTRAFVDLGSGASGRAGDPGRGPDPERDRLYVRVRRDWDNIQPEQAEALEVMEPTPRTKWAQRGCWIISKTHSPNAFRMSEPAEVMVEGFERALARY